MPVSARREILRVSSARTSFDTDKQYLKFGTAFEKEFIGQGKDENRSMAETLDIGWRLLHILPRGELDRIDTKILEKYWD